MNLRDELDQLQANLDADPSTSTALADLAVRIAALRGVAPGQSWLRGVADAVDDAASAAVSNEIDREARA